MWREWNTGSVSTEHSRAVDTSAPTVTNRKANYFQAATGFDDALLLHDAEMRQILNRSSTRCQSTTVQMPRIYSLSFSALLHLKSWRRVGLHDLDPQSNMMLCWSSALSTVTANPKNGIYYMRGGAVHDQSCLWVRVYKYVHNGSQWHGLTFSQLSSSILYK